MIGAQYGQDALVLRILNRKRGGYFLDSGACDGIQASNTLRLERAFGWRGICVEPDPAFFAELVRERSCHCVNACLDVRSGEAAFVAAGTLGGLLACYEPASLDTLRRERPGVTLTTRPARTIREVLDEAGAPRIIDYWSLDTEGSELALLESFPYDAYTFRVLTVEHNHHQRTREAMRRVLAARGFARFCAIEIDDCYVNTRLGMTAPHARVMGRGLAL